jgi:hypothetical protein
VRFGNGVALSDVTVSNPPGIPYPVADDELYLTFALVSTDGRPLDKAKRAVLTAMSTSFNSGFQLDHSKFRRDFGWWFNKGATVSRGGLPVLVARVGATVRAPMLDGMRYTLRDWHLGPIASGTVRDGTLRIAPEQPVFLVDLERD